MGLPSLAASVKFCVYLCNGVLFIEMPSFIIYLFIFAVFHTNGRHSVSCFFFFSFIWRSFLNRT